MTDASTSSATDDGGPIMGDRLSMPEIGLLLNIVRRGE